MLVKSKVKYIQSLGQKKFRDEEQVFIAEGPKIVKELLESGNADIKELYAIREWIDENALLLKKTEINEITEAELARISQLTTANKVIAIARQFDEPEKIITKEKIILALDTIQDPGNFGTIIRIADWFGIDYVICNQGCADIYNPKVVQATMGSIARVKVIYTDLEKWLKETNTDIYITALDGQDIREVERMKEGIIVIGNESKGISPGIIQLAKTKLTIPKKGKAESLNAAVATGIILSHII